MNARYCDRCHTAISVHDTHFVEINDTHVYHYACYETYLRDVALARLIERELELMRQEGVA